MSHVMHAHDRYPILCVYCMYLLLSNCICELQPCRCVIIGTFLTFSCRWSCVQPQGFAAIWAVSSAPRAGQAESGDCLPFWGKFALQLVSPYTLSWILHALITTLKFGVKLCILHWNNIIVYLVFLQMHCNLDQEVQTIAINYPYIAVVMGSSSHQLFIVAERLVLCEVASFTDALITLISTYYAFDMSYPKQFHPILIFVQKIIMHINDSSPIPTSVTKIISALDKLSA